MKHTAISAGEASTRPAAGGAAGLAGRLGRMIKQRGLLDTALHCRSIALIRAHRALFDRRIEALEQEKSAGYVPLGDLSIDSANKPIDNADIHYLPTPVMLVRWVLDLLPAPLDKTTFVDYGSGRGRVLLCAAQYPFKAVAGVEFADELYAAAQKNLAGLDPALVKCGAIGNTHGDAADFAVPDGAAVLFFFNPFEEHLMAQVRNKIATSYRADPRPLTIVYLNPRQRRLFDSDPDFEAIPLPLAAAVKFALFSPFQVALYRATSRHA